MLPRLFRAHRNLIDTQAQLLAAEAELRITESLYETLQPVMVTDAHAHILRVNRAFVDMMGYSVEEVLGKTPKLFRSNHHDDAFYHTMLDCIARSGQWQGEVWDRRKDGEVFPKWMHIATVMNAAGEVTNMVASYLDISEQKRAEVRIQQLAFHDVLTGLANRILLRERLQRAMADSARQGHYGALLLLDLDHFKTLNDSLGHPVGDTLLQHAGERLSLCVAELDTVARLGGDEFAVVLAELHDVQEHAAAKAEAVGERILEALGRGYSLNGTHYHGTASLGIVLFCGVQHDENALLKQAEMAMYQAKSDGRNRLHFFDVALERAITERTTLERELRAGIAAEQLVLYYQPQVAVGCGVVGAEALVRWNHPHRGLLAPALFIPLAEETGLILPLGKWVLEAACQQLAAWAREPDFAELTLAVNISVPQFRQGDFAEYVLALLERSGARPERLKLEITESLLLTNVDAVIAAMQTLKARGVRFSLDDFGTGYSSLTYLKRLPLDQLKIDQSFVRHLGHDANDEAIARSVTALAHSLGLEPIAEGVETLAQRYFLARIGCTVYQGYYFSHPLPLAEFVRWVRTAAPTLAD
ncbi:MAG: putative bifunctional diguanylate cyclase/phosphodiesterase [Rhodanobacter sp.]